MSTLAFAATVLLAASAVRAQPPHNYGFAEVALGASVPISDASYQRIVQPSFKPSLRGGYAFWTAKWLGIAPELQVDLIPLSAAALPNVVDPSYRRYRFLAGSRLLFNFGAGAVFVRFLVGGDYLTGSQGGYVIIHQTGQSVYSTSSFTSTSFTLQPGAGVQFRFLKYCVAGVSIDFPVAMHAFYPDQPFMPIDVDVLALLGFRR